MIFFNEGKFMRCENLFCVYWINDNCSLDEIYLDIQGSCQSCIYVDINENDLESYRRNHFKKYEGINL